MFVFYKSLLHFVVQSQIIELSNQVVLTLLNVSVDMINPTQNLIVTALSSDCITAELAYENTVCETDHFQDAMQYMLKTVWCLTESNKYIRHMFKNVQPIWNLVYNDKPRQITRIIKGMLDGLIVEVENEEIRHFKWSKIQSHQGITIS